MNDSTLVLTSCGRLDLLDITLKSIGASKLDTISNKIIIDDSGDSSVRKYFSKYKKENGWNIIINETNIGHPRSVDKAYKYVSTPYIFHCEDDWEFTGTSYISEGLDVLEFDKNLLQVTFREGCPHPVYPEVNVTPNGTSYQIKEKGWRGEWWGFTYNPSIFRKSAYDRFGTYSGKREQTISKEYYDLGYYTAALTAKGVHHIGEGRGTFSYGNLI